MGGEKHKGHGCVDTGQPGAAWSEGKFSRGPCLVRTVHCSLLCTALWNSTDEVWHLACLLASSSSSSLHPPRRFGPLLQNPPSFPAPDLLFFMDNAVNEALGALTSANLRLYTDLQCPKARRWRLKAVQRLVRRLLGDPNIVCGTNTKGEVCLSGGACTALSAPLGGHLAFTAQEHEALSMLRMACSMDLSQRALLRMPRRCTQRGLRTVRQRVMPYFPQATIVKSTTGRNRAAAHVPLQSIVHNGISMARAIGNLPPNGVAIVVISVDAPSLWKASSTRADVWVNVWGGGQSMLRR